MSVSVGIRDLIVQHVFSLHCASAGAAGTCGAVLQSCWLREQAPILESAVHLLAQGGFLRC